MLDRENTMAALEDGIQHKLRSTAVRETLWLDGLQHIPGEMIESARNVLDPVKVDSFLAGIEDCLRAGAWQPELPEHKRVFCTSMSRGSAGGKWRDLYCPYLQDHIIHHIIMRASMPAFTRGMMRWCVANVKGRGTADAVHAIRSWCQDPGWRYFVHLDIRKFFDSISLDSVENALARKIGDPILLDLHHRILTSSPLPCPVGYYPSPWYANLVLEPLDHMIMEQLCKTRRGVRKPLIRHSIRYMDDLLLMSASRRDLERAVDAIGAWLSANLNLQLKPTWEIKSIAEYTPDGRIRPETYRIEYIGYRFDRTRTILKSGNYISTKRLASRMHSSDVRGSGASLRQCRQLLSKTGFSQIADQEHFMNEINGIYPVNKAKEALSTYDKSRVFRTSGTGNGQDPGQRGKNQPDRQRY